MQTCAYCEKTGIKLTKEHLWPASLHRRIDEANRDFFKQANIFYLSKADKFVMCYNSARIHNSDIKRLAKCKGYILGKAPHPDHAVIHLQLVYPTDFSPSELQIAKELGLKLTRHEPRLNLVGHFGYMTRTGIGRIIRAVHLQSHLFLIHLFPDKVSQSERLLVRNTDETK